MIFGETTEQWIARASTPQRWFAWHPVYLSDGRIAWLCYVMRRKSVFDFLGHKELSEFWRYEL